MKQLKRGAGILLSVTSLPSKYGIGTLGTEAYHFVDLLVDLRQTYWQVLPIGPTGLGDSPYQSFSAFAGNPYMVDLEALAQEGLLELSSINEYSWGNETDKIDYAAIFHNRFKVLRLAFEKFDTDNEEFKAFVKENDFWLSDYALFMAIKEKYEYSRWQDFAGGLREHRETDVLRFKKDFEKDVYFWEFVQFKFFTQWFKLKKYANDRGIQIIGEVPLYVSEDSADVWAHRDLFEINRHGFLDEAAGCPRMLYQQGASAGVTLYITGTTSKRMTSSGGRNALKSTVKFTT